MKAARIHGYNQDPVVEDVPVPDVGSNDVLVRVAAASLNPLDLKLRDKVMYGFFPLSFPYTIGTDLSGTIEQVGASVTGWAVGQAVIARADPTAGGALAEYAVVPATHVAAAPEAALLEDAAGLPTTAGTAWQALVETGHLAAGQTVLVHAGAGGVGSMAIQIARDLGARVIATASGPGLETARVLGADRVIDYRSEAFESQVSDADLVIDTIGGDTQVRSFGVLRAGGHLVSTVSPPDEAMARAHGVTGTFFAHQTDGGRLARVAGLVDAGKVRVVVDRRVGLDRLDKALAHLASARARGKVLVTLP